MIILFACLVGWLDSSEIKEIKARSLKNCLGLCLGWCEYRHAHLCAGAIVRPLTKATILGTLCTYTLTLDVNTLAKTKSDKNKQLITLTVITLSGFQCFLVIKCILA